MKALELGDNLKTEVKGLYFIKGEDYYLRNMSFNAFKKLIDNDLIDFNYIVQNGLEDAKALISDCNTLPFISEHKIIIVKGCENANKFTLTALSSYMKEPCLSTVLVLELFDDSFKELYPYGISVDCGKLDMRSVIKLIYEECALNKSTISNEAAAKLAVLANFDMNSISVKLQKLCAYCDGEEISLEAVVELISPEAELQVFELTKVISQGQNKDVLSITKNLLSRGEKPSFLLSNLTAQYRRMLHTSLSDAGDSELAAYLKVKPYAVTAARSLAKAYTQVTLKKIVDKLIELEFGFKSGKFSEEDALKFAIAYLIKKED